MACLFLSGLPAWAASLRASASAGYGRLTFTGAAPRAVLADGVLVLSFANTPGLSAAQMERALPGYISTARMDADGRTFRLALAQPVRLHVSQSGAVSAVDLVPAGFAGTPPNLPPPPPPEPKAVDVAALPALKVRAGAYAHFVRLVFDWQRKVPYAVFPGDGRISVRFEARVRPDFSGLKAASPPWVKEAGWRIDGAGTVIDFDTVSNSGYHDFRDGTHVVLDLLAPKTDAEAYNPPGVSRAEAKTEIVKGRPDLSNAPATSAAQRDDILRTAAKVDGKPDPGAAAALPEPTPRPDDAAAAVPAPAQTVAPASDTDVKADADSATLAFAKVRGVAAFVRGLEAFIVLDGAKPVDTAFLKSALASFPQSVEVSNQNGVSILRLVLKQPEQMSVRSQDGKIVVALAPKLANTDAVPIDIVRDDETADAAALKAELPGAQNTVPLSDPGVGDTLIAVPALPGHIIDKPRRFVDFAAIPSAAGLVLAPFADNLRISSGGDAVRIGRPHGLTLTAAAAPIPSSPSVLAATAFGPTFIDFAAWAHPLRGSFYDTELKLRAAAARLPSSDANAARRTEARFYVANDFGPEALGLINVIQTSDPALQDDAQLQTIRAAADVMMARDKDAISALSGAVFESDPHAALWRGLAEADLEQWPAASADLGRAMSVIGRYPPEWQARGRIAYANAAIATGALARAHDALAQVFKDLPKRQLMDAKLARARLTVAENGYSAAAPLFAAVEEGANPQDAANAIYDDTVAGLAIGAIGQDEAIGRLEALRYRWRGDQLELKTLRKLGALYFAQKKWREGLGILHTAVIAFPHDESTRQAQDDMRGAFVQLFLKGRADGMAPIKALGLFYDFIDLTPIGAEGDEMIRRMAERLVRVDLLGPAEQLLKYQVDKRLDGVAQAQVAARLAMIDLMDHKPKEALAALRATRVAGMPDDITHERLLLEARALAALKQYDEAVDLIAVDQAPDTRRLRADIYWERGDWAVAAQKSEDLVGDAWQGAVPLTSEQRRYVMRAAIAYSLAGDNAGIARLRANFTAKMAGTPDASAFAVVTQSMDTQGVAFRDVAAKVASIDTLESFMTDFKKQFDAIPLVRSAVN